MVKRDINVGQAQAQELAGLCREITRQTLPYCSWRVLGGEPSGYRVSLFIAEEHEKLGPKGLIKISNPGGAYDGAFYLPREKGIILQRALTTCGRVSTQHIDEEIFGDGVLESLVFRFDSVPNLVACVPVIDIRGQPTAVAHDIERLAERGIDIRQFLTHKMPEAGNELMRKLSGKPPSGYEYT